MRRLPPPNSAPHQLLLTLLAGPGTFYQICERAGWDIEAERNETTCRKHFATMIENGHGLLRGLIYSISHGASVALAPPTPYAGEVAGPAFRGSEHIAPVRVVRRPAPDRRAVGARP